MMMLTPRLLGIETTRTWNPPAKMDYRGALPSNLTNGKASFHFRWNKGLRARGSRILFPLDLFIAMEWFPEETPY